MKYDEEADIRTDTAIKIMALFFASIMFLAFTTDPIASGTKEGQRAPALEGLSYNGTGWTEFNMDDWLVDNWSAGDDTGEWLVVEFIDTDCGFCWDSASETGQAADYFSKTGAEKWDGPVVNFVANVGELNIPGHESSRSESLPLEINRVKKHALRAIVQPVLVILTISRTLTIWTWTTWMNGRCQEHQHITSFNPMVLWLGFHLKTPVKKSGMPS